jgi:16S rRNA (uracil1498-N3)-methyltransferase
VSRPQFLVPTLPSQAQYVLEGVEGHHAADVLRLRPGEELVLADGRGGTALASVRAVGRGRLDLSIVECRYTPPSSPRLVVAQAVAKGDRAELAVQAMTEVGVDEIVPWTASRSVAVWRGERSLERWRAVAREAAKQSRRAWVPVVAPAATTAQLAGRVTVVLHSGAADRLSSVELPDGEDVVLAIGPEGGITPEELLAFTTAGARPAALGRNVLRTSTAGVAALAVLSARLGRW